MYKIKSKFAYLPIFICGLLTAAPFLLLYLTLNSPEAGVLIPILYLIFVAYFWLTEFRVRAHKIKITNNQITRKNFFGLGKEKVFDIKNIDGFITSFQPSRYESYEYIFIIQQEKRVASISKFYHRNYEEIKLLITQNIRDLGLKEYKFGHEIKEMFK